MAKTEIKNQLKKSADLKKVAIESKGITKKVKKQLVTKKEKAVKQNVKPITKSGQPAKADEAVNKLKKVGKEKKAPSKEIIKEISDAVLKKRAKKKEKKIQKKLVKKTLKIEGKALKKPPKDKQEVIEPITKKPPKPKKKNVPKAPSIVDKTGKVPTVFVGNIPTNTKTVQLSKLFKEYGPIQSIRMRTASGKKIFKHKDRKEAGSLIAYISFCDEEAVERALVLNNFEFKGNHLRVTRSEERGPKNKKNTVVVGNLKYSATEEKLREIFSSCGEIDSIRCLQVQPKDIVTNPKQEVTAGCRGIAYVCFKSPEAVGLALELKDTLLDDRPINVERYSDKKKGTLKARLEEEKLTKVAKKSKNAKVTKVKKTVTGVKNDETATKKKTVFHGVKIDSIKKKTKGKADKKLKAIAKKVAPKSLLKQK